jgi:hypothetical protein
MRSRGWRYGFAVADAVALGCWASAGTIKALAAGLGWLPAIGHGIWRDRLRQSLVRGP